MVKRSILVLLLCACAPFLISMTQEGSSAGEDKGAAQVQEAMPSEAPKPAAQQENESGNAQPVPQDSVQTENSSDSSDNSGNQTDMKSNVMQEESADKAEEQKQEQKDALRKEQSVADEGSINVGDLKFEVEKRRKAVVDLVNRGVKDLKEKPSIDQVFSDFSHTKAYIDGDLYLFVYDMKGVCLAHGENPEYLWQNLIELKDWVGTPVVKEIIKTSKDGGGWVTYGWNNSTKVSYVQRVDRDGASYAIGSGYYPHSKHEAVVNLVKGGVALFNQIKQDGDPVDWAFSRMSYPRGRFIAGNLYLYALDFKGDIVAQGERPGLIGSNSWDYQDSDGKYANREIVTKLQNSSEGIWITYKSKRADKEAYAEKVKDREGKEYFIACGYYPEADREQVIDLVRKGYQFMKTHGKTSAVEEFSQRRDDQYRYGDLELVVYDLKGVVIAHGGNPDSIGINMFDSLDEDGVTYIKNMVTRANKDGIWVNAKIKGSFQSTFAQKIDLGVDSFVIACSYYPVSKPETMMLLVQSAASFLRNNPRAEAFGEFKQKGGMFRRGDLELFVVDTQGLCYVWGDDYSLIWRNIINLNDDNGKPFIKMFIDATKGGTNIVNAYFNNAFKVNYVVPVTKDSKLYIVGSGYYQ